MERFATLRIGNATLITLRDSWTTLSPLTFFGAVEAAAWEPYRDLLEGDGSMMLNFGVSVVRSRGQTIVVDTGIGGRPVPLSLRETPALPEVMRSAGVTPDEVDIVAFSHLHFDHTGWNTVDEGGEPRPLFPNARHLVQQREWDHWTGADTGPHGPRYDDVLAPLEAAGLLDLIDGERDITSELVAIPTPGHTPGHMSFAIASGGEGAYILGDVAHHPAQVSEPTWSPNADGDPELAARTRAALFERIERESALIASGHFEFPGLGHARRDGERLRFEALEAGA